MSDVEHVQTPEPLRGESVGSILRQTRENKRMTLGEVARVTRISIPNLEALEAGRFDELPGEVFTRGFLRSYAQAVGESPDAILAKYTQHRRVRMVTPLPVSSPVSAARTRDGGRRFGIAIALVLLLILFTLALSIVLKPRGRDVPPELSSVFCPRPPALLRSAVSPGVTASRA